MSGPKFNLEFDPSHGNAVRIGDGIRRITATNSGPFTFHGTNTFIVGTDHLAIIDPGPNDPAHVEAILRAVGSAEISHIIVTHTHGDHSPAAATLKVKTGAKTYGEGPHRPARDLFIGEKNPFDASSDMDFQPDVILADGDTIEGSDWSLEAIATPGHTANHMCFALAQEDLLFSGDHVMGWSTSIVAPPDGSMSDYMASLERLMARSDGQLVPAHGGPVDRVSDYLSDLKTHRRGREQAVLDQLAAGEQIITDMVRAIYTEISEKLHPAAALSMLAHLEDLVSREEVVTQGPPSISGRYRLAKF